MFNFSSPKVPTIEAISLKKSIDGDEDFLLLDVRTKQEFARGKIQGSINLPLDEVSKKISSICTDKSKKIYVYCLSGSRSIIAVDIMIKMGYKNVFDLKSGLLAWRANQYPIQN